MIKPCPFPVCEADSPVKRCIVCDGKGKVFALKESVIRRRMSLAHLYDLERDGWQSLSNHDPKTKYRYIILPDKEFR